MRSALEGVEGVSKATVSMPDKAVITAKADADTKELIKAAKKAVKAAGYKASVKKK